METLVSFLAAHKMVLLVAVIASIIIIISFIKKLVKFALVVIAALVLYAAFLIYTGQKVPTTKKEVIRHGIEKANAAARSGARAIRGGR